MVDPQVLPENAIIGLHHLNQGAFYKAHEYFEDVWRETTDDSREFYRALLHISGGFYRLGQDRVNAAHKFFSHSLYWLDRFPNEYLGFDLVPIKRFLENLMKRIQDGTPAEKILKSSQSILHTIIASKLMNIS